MKIDIVNQNPCLECKLCTSSQMERVGQMREAVWQSLGKKNDLPLRTVLGKLGEETIIRQHTERPWWRRILPSDKPLGEVKGNLFAALSDGTVAFSGNQPTLIHLNKKGMSCEPLLHGRSIGIRKPHIFYVPSEGQKNASV